MRDGLTEEDFWAHVLSTYAVGDDLAPDPDEWAPSTDARGLGIVVISDHVSPCPICHSWTACGYDTEGRPMIHAFYDEETGP